MPDPGRCPSRDQTPSARAALATAGISTVLALPSAEATIDDLEASPQGVSEQVTVGFRVFARGAMPDMRQIAAFEGLGSSNVADAMHGMGCMSATVRPIYWPMRSFAGPALTVTVSPGNGMMIRKAIAVSRPGDVVIANAGGVLDRAILGGNVAIDMVAHGVAGLVVDGAVRDIDELRELDLPVYARGLTPRSGSDPSGRGEVLAPVACAGVAVIPGDIVIADADGVTVVPLADADAVHRAAIAIQAKKGSRHDLADRFASARAGTLTAYDPAAVNRALDTAGCVELEEPWRPVQSSGTVGQSSSDDAPRHT